MPNTTNPFDIGVIKLEEPSCIPLTQEYTHSLSLASISATVFGAGDDANASRTGSLSWMRSYELTETPVHDAVVFLSCQRWRRGLEINSGLF